eukprot:TRINITY_DN3601_c1_g1_i4.p2 TRINITY_DN3601_c1_g1~~TRINITY_DN3601_c1_g1_i4.p2  ORF type:complete len:223 (-),score=-8.62 TRINITY_DN3601_c1_g1_i4:55-723(-)
MSENVRIFQGDIVQSRVCVYFFVTQQLSYINGYKKALTGIHIYTQRSFLFIVWYLLGRQVIVCNLVYFYFYDLAFVFIVYTGTDVYIAFDYVHVYSLALYFLWYVFFNGMCRVYMLVGVAYSHLIFTQFTYNTFVNILDISFRIKFQFGVFVCVKFNLYLNLLYIKQVQNSINGYWMQNMQVTRENGYVSLFIQIWYRKFVNILMCMVGGIFKVGCNGIVIS